MLSHIEVMQNNLKERVGSDMHLTMACDALKKDGGGLYLKPVVFYQCISYLGENYLLRLRPLIFTEERQHTVCVWRIKKWKN